MPPLIQQEKHILATLASEQEEIRRLAAVQRAAQVSKTVQIFRLIELPIYGYGADFRHKRLMLALLN